MPPLPPLPLLLPDLLQLLRVSLVAILEDFPKKYISHIFSIKNTCSASSPPADGVTGASRSGEAAGDRAPPETEAETEAEAEAAAILEYSSEAAKDLNWERKERRRRRRGGSTSKEEGKSYKRMGFFLKKKKDKKIPRFANKFESFFKKKGKKNYIPVN